MVFKLLSAEEQQFYENDIKELLSEISTGYVIENVKSDAFFLAVFDSSALVGIGYGYPKQFRDDENRLFVEVLHVKNKYRRYGIEKQLIEKIEEIAENAGFRKVYMCVTAENQQLPLSFSDFGFQAERIKLEYDLDKHNVFTTPDFVRRVDILFLNEHLDEFKMLYYENDKSHIYTDSMAMEEAEYQMELLKTYLEEERVCYYSAVYGEKVCGALWAYPCKGPNNMRHMHVKQITVDSAYRGHQIAARLFESLFDFMQREEYDTVATYCDVANLPARKMYQKVGFVPVEYQIVKSIGYIKAP